VSQLRWLLVHNFPMAGKKFGRRKWFALAYTCATQPPGQVQGYLWAGGEVGSLCIDSALRAAPNACLTAASCYPIAAKMCTQLDTPRGIFGCNWLYLQACLQAGEVAMPLS
jgi:hypothetical protein